MTSITIWPSSIGIPILEEINQAPPHPGDPPTVAGQATTPYTRLWSIVAGRIQWSDNYGDTWNYSWLNGGLVQFPLLNPSPGPEPTLFRDSRGNFYYFAQDGDLGRLYRVKKPGVAGTQWAIEPVINFAVNGQPRSDPNPWARTPYLKPWAIAEGTGKIYVGQYSMVNDAAHDPALVSIPAAYLWVSSDPATSPDYGRHFDRKDTFAHASRTVSPAGQVEPDTKHVHVVKCDPFQPGATYVSTGDTLKQFAVSVDACNTFYVLDDNRNAPKSGYTAVAFTDDAIIVGDDLNPGFNAVRFFYRDGSWAQPVVPGDVLPAPLSVCGTVMGLVPYGNDEIWMLTLCGPDDDIPGTTSGLLTGIIRLRRTAPAARGPGAWESSIVLACEPRPRFPAPSQSHGGRFMYLCEDRDGRIPQSCRYAFGVFLRFDEATWQLVRIHRAFPQ